MKLWQDKSVVGALQQVLEDYPYLEYDEAETKLPLKDARADMPIKDKRADMLKIKITDSSEKSASAGKEIASELSKATGRKFEYIPSDRRFKKKHIRIVEFRHREPENDPETDNS